ncbi:hypothetical protein O9993_05990 [Vibrio lentus]|nr:hypothetical protein [Vibrio lentus]
MKQDLASLSRKGKDNIKLNFAVSDSGIGMTQEQAAKLFNKFTQADSLPLKIWRQA